MKLTLAIVLGLAIAGSTVSASAQQFRGRGKGPQQGLQQRQHPQQRQGAQALQPPIAAVFDANNNGVLDKDEITNAVVALTKLNTTDDNKLTVDELCVGACPNQGHCPAPGQGAGRGRGFGKMGANAGQQVPLLLRLFDTDKNGEISVQEVSKAPAVLAALDANGDGQLTPSELHPMAGCDNARSCKQAPVAE